MNKRIKKAIDYLNKHKTKKHILVSKQRMLQHLKNDKNLYTIKENLNGGVYLFVKSLSKRFKLGFTVAEYVLIITSLTPIYTDEQNKFYNSLNK